MNFCFVILHYKTEKDTIECINSILKQKEHCSIVVVDNFSNNGSIEKVEKFFSKQKNVIFLKNNANLGFASGNNVGYKYAKNELHADFIAVLNNDIILNSKYLITQIKSKYELNRFHVFGPDIVSLVDYKHQNPMDCNLLSIREINMLLIKLTIKYLLNRVGFLDFVLNLKEKIIVNSSSKSNIQPNTIFNDMQNVVLHGSFIVFSKDYIMREDCAFLEGTFLFMEEILLYEYCRRNNYITYFSPDISVFHKEDSSTNSLCETDKSKLEFILKNHINSLKVYKKLKQKKII